MALLLSYPMTGPTLGSGLTLGANGVTVSSAASPSGISGRIVPGVTAPDGALCTLSRIVSTDAEVFGGIRSELSCDQGAGLTGANIERWYAWEMFVPADFAIATPWLSAFQIHDDPDGGDAAKYPNFVLALQNNGIRVLVPKNAPTEETAFRSAGAATLITGRWVVCALHAFWAPDATGFMEFSYDGKTVMREWLRASHFVDVLRPYPKWGLYDTLKVAATITDHSAYYRNMRIFSGRDTAASVLGAAMLPQPRRP